MSLQTGAFRRNISLGYFLELTLYSTQGWIDNLRHIENEVFWPPGDRNCFAFIVESHKEDEVLGTKIHADTPDSLSSIWAKDSQSDFPEATFFRQSTLLSIAENPRPKLPPADSPFLTRLPVEVRELIYDLLINSEHTITLPTRHPSILGGLHNACKQTRSEILTWSRLRGNTRDLISSREFGIINPATTTFLNRLYVFRKHGYTFGWVGRPLLAGTYHLQSSKDHHEFEWLEREFRKYKKALAGITGAWRSYRALTRPLDMFWSAQEQTGIPIKGFKIYKLDEECHFETEVSVHDNGEDLKLVINGSLV